MSALVETLGRKMTAQEVAEYLGVDAETVRRYYPYLGGIRLGRLILFFENLVIQKIKERSHALQEDEKEQGGMGSRCHAPGEAVFQDIRNQGEGIGLGVGNKKRSRGRIDDPYGLLDAD
jgi:hypothetical protein